MFFAVKFLDLNLQLLTMTLLVGWALAARYGLSQTCLVLKGCCVRISLAVASQGAVLQ